MAAKFPGFPAQTFTFFKSLKKNNNREWFTEHKATYEEKVKAPMVAFVEAINSELATFAPNYITDPKKAIYRIYRDTRFSKDKTPYKTNIGASFNKQRNVSAGFYVGISAEGIECGGGIYMPGPEEILAVRQYIEANPEKFLDLVTEKKLVKSLGELKGEKLSRTPKGFPCDHPAELYLRHKQWYFYRDDIDPALAQTPKLLGDIIARFKLMAAFIEFIDQPLNARSARPRFQAEDYF